MPNDFDELVRQAKAGDQDALGRLLVECQRLARLQARYLLHHGIRSKVAESDVFQDAALLATRLFAGFHGWTMQEFAAWFRALVLQTIHQQNRYYLDIQKRDVRRETSLHTHTHTHTHSGD